MSRTWCCCIVILMLAGCGSRASGGAPPSSFHHPQRAVDYCVGRAVYESPDSDSLVGRLITEGDIDGVRAINLSMLIDGEARSVWRREPEVLQWYVRDGDTGGKQCVWRARTYPLYVGKLEYGLDTKLVRRSRGWTTERP